MFFYDRIDALRQLPHLLHSSSEPFRLSAVVEQLCQRVSNLQYIVTIVTQVRIYIGAWISGDPFPSLVMLWAC